MGREGGTTEGGGGGRANGLALESPTQTDVVPKVFVHRGWAMSFGVPPSMMNYFNFFGGRIFDF